MNIAAISTPAGIGGLAVIRISGPDSISIVESIFRPFRQEHILTERPTHTLTFGTIVGDDESLVDEVVVSLYRAPHSFTGENVVEISCHGSQFIQQTLLKLLISRGCRLAEPGEFTRRAFQNGRMDLSQAEAVADLIAATSRASHRLAMSQMKGSFSRRLSALRDQLIELSSLLELELDFSEEEVEFANRQQLRDLAANIHSQVSALAESFRTGDAIRNGIPVTIIGETNAGKSTLLNLLLGDDKAIVSEVKGTTRDVIEDTATLDGTLLRFIDTAGIRDTDDKVERLGISRTYQRLDRAAIVVWMIDGTRLGDARLTEELAEDAIRTLRHIMPYLHREQRLIISINKADLVSKTQLQRNLPTLQGALNLALQSADIDLTSSSELTYVTLSAKEGTGVSLLRQAISRAVSVPDMREGDVIVTNLRHYQALTDADAAILRVSAALEANLTGDLIAEDLRQCNFHLGSIVGQVTNDEILSSIFSRFCIGK